MGRMDVQSVWDQMNHATRQVALYVCNTSEAYEMAKDVARCVLSDNGSRRLECEEHYDKKVVPAQLIADIFKAFCTSSQYWGPQINRLFRKNVDYLLLAEWWIAVVRTPDNQRTDGLTDPPPKSAEDKLTYAMHAKVEGEKGEAIRRAKALLKRWEDEK